MANIKIISILLILSACLFFLNLGNMAITDPDESFYAETAKEMMDAGEWVTPLIFGEPQFEKPVFYYWLVILSYIVLGVSEFAARFPSAIFGLIGVIGIFYLGKTIFSPLCGFLSGIILASSFQYLILARACVTDIVLTVFILLCFTFFIKAWKEGGRAYYVLAAVMSALAVLTKGPIGLFITGGTIGLYVILTNGWKDLRKVPIIWCVIAFFAVSLPWYLAAYKIHGRMFIDEFFMLRNMTRFLEPEHKIGTSPFFYLPVIFGGFFPWSVFLPVSAIDMYKKKVRIPGVKAPHLFFAIWFLCIFVFFSISRTKLVTYILPLFPVMAVIVGRFWEKIISGTDETVIKPAKFSYAILTVLSAIGVVGIFFVIKNEYPEVLFGGVIASICFAISALLGTSLFIKGKYRMAFGAVVVGVTAVLVMLTFSVAPVIAKYESSKTLSIKVNELASPEDAIGGENDHRRGIAFYTGRKDITDIHPFGELTKFILRKKPVWCIIQKKHYEVLKKHKEKNISEPIFVSGKYVIITNDPNYGK